MKKKNEPFIVVKDLSLDYGGDVIVRDVNFTVNSGDIFVIMGMSGCGKSTIMRSIIGLLAPTHGHIFIDGTDIWALDSDARTKIIGQFGISFQSGALFSSMTIGENIALGLELKTELTRQEINRRVREKLKLVGLDGTENLYPSEISGGMIKRAALARALINDPEVLFFDEPSAGLDPVRSAELDELIKCINHRAGTTIVMVTHELPTIMTIATNSVYLDARTRTVAASGAPKQILKTTKNPQVIDFLTRGHKGGKQ